MKPAHPVTRRLLPSLLAVLLPLLVAPPSPAAAATATTSATATTAATATAATAATPSAGRSLYVPVDPVRMLDTRSGLGAPTGRVGAGEVRDLLVADGVRVPAGATAVVLNVTVTQPSADTDVRVYPTPSGSGAPPTVSNLNTVPGRTVANLVTVAVGSAGRVRLRNAAGEAHLVADLAGYYTATGEGASLVSGAPSRLLDTRAARVPLGPGEVRRLQVVGPDGVPAGTAAVVLNVTAVGASAETDVRVYPTRPGPPPVVSNLNPAPGRTTAAAVVVPVGDDGTVSLRNSAGDVHLVVDLLARYVPGGGGAVFAPVAPVRLLDTRTSGGPLGPGGTRDVVVAGRGAVPAPGTAVVLNVTATGPTAASDVRAYAAGTGSPDTSNLNVVRGQTVANTVVASVGQDGAVRLRNAAGSLHLVVDLAGWYGPAGDGWDVSWPQCTTAGSTASRLPVGGAFAVVGLTRGRPFTANECFAAQWSWANTLPGEPAVYLNVNAPGPRTTPDGQRWLALCGSGTATSTCGRAYGVALAQYALERMPRVARSGGRPMVWMDVEGPYANGPFWQSGTGGVAVNRAVLNGAVETLRAAGHRVGIYTDRGLSTANDWRDIMGDYRLTQTQNWVFRAPTADAAPLCTPAESATGGPVVMVQVQPQQSGQVFDVNHLCPGTPVS